MKEYRSSSAKSPAPAVAKAVQILDFLANQKPEAGVSEIAVALQINKSTCFNILRTLTESRIVIKESRYPVYRLGPKLVELGTASRRNFSYRDQVKQQLRPLVDEAGVACLIGQLLPKDTGIVVMDRVVPRREDVLLAPIGHVYPLSAPAMGRAVLARRDDDDVLLAAQTAGMAEVSQSELLADLQGIRQQGFATSREEYQAGVNAVAVTVLDEENEIAMVLCLIGEVKNLSEHALSVWGRNLRQTAHKIEVGLQPSSNTFFNRY